MNELNSYAAEQIAHGLAGMPKSCSVVKLYLLENDLGSDGALEIQRAMARLTHVTTLTLVTDAHGAQRRILEFPQ